MKESIEEEVDNEVKHGENQDGIKSIKNEVVVQKKIIKKKTNLQYKKKGKKIIIHHIQHTQSTSTIQM